MSLTIQYVIIALVLAGCVIFMAKGIKRLVRSKDQGCCNCKLKDSCCNRSGNDGA